MSTVHPKSLLLSRGLSAKHHFGQNFLSDPGLCDKIAALATPEGTQSTLEIGAGLGALTGSLLARTPLVVAIERDRDLVPMLGELFHDAIALGRLEVVEADAKTYDYSKKIDQIQRPATLCGNLPYQLTGPILRLAIELAPRLTRVTFLVQLEVADRLVAEPDTEAYGALTVFLQARFKPKRSLVIKRGAFYPQPNVDSAVVVLDPLEEPLAVETPLFRNLVKSAFAQRRKKLRNAWSSVLPNSRQLVEPAAEEAGISLDLRGEVLSVQQYARMADVLQRMAAMV